MRLFLALDLDSAARARAAEAQRRARKAAERQDVTVRWVRPQNLHLTLAFLGEVDADRAALARRAAGEAWPHPPFRIELASLEVVPRSGAPRTVWLPVSAGLRELEGLHADVRTRMGPFAATPVDPRLRAHVTLGRVRRASRASGRIREAMARLSVPTIGWEADTVTLYESRLTPGGASYRALARTPLRCVILDGGS